MRLPHAAVSFAAAALLMPGCSGTLSPAAVSPSVPTSNARAQSASNALRLAADTTRAGRPAMSSGKSWISPEAKTAPVLYVSDYTAVGYVNVYAQKGKNHGPIGQLTGFAYPANLFVDAQGDLFVADSNDFDVPVYHQGSTTPFETLQDPNEYPFGVAENSHGTMYVASDVSSGGLPGNVAVYTGGSLTPTASLSDPRWFSAIDVAVDKSDNVYVCYDTQSGGGTFGVDEFLAGTTTPVDLGLNIDSCQGLQLDHRQNLIVADTYAPAVDIFPPGTTTPSAVLGKQGAPAGVALTKNAKEIFVGDSSTGAVEEYTYPGGRLLQTITSGLSRAYGVATDPAAKN
jgi:hypothetical protein